MPVRGRGRAARAYGPPRGRQHLTIIGNDQAASRVKKATACARPSSRRPRGTPPAAAQHRAALARPRARFHALLWAVDHGLTSISKRMERALGITGPQRLVVRIVGRRPASRPGSWPPRCTSTPGPSRGS